ncbi:MAG: DUF3105 domain-containing protein [Burkholderiales bacterium]|nr:DUF3105 domain-containing protein [Anaerolineae bacterium]
MRGQVPTPLVIAGLHRKGFFRIPMICAILLICGLSAAFAQETLDVDAEPLYGSVLLDAGFTLDPYIVSMQSGGDVDVSALNLDNPECGGYVLSLPDFRLDWVEAPASLRIFFTSEGDTTLIVRDPNGQFLCNNDFDGVNPTVEIDMMTAGPYAIWVGSQSSDVYSDGYLILTEGDLLPSEMNSLLGGVISADTTGHHSAGFGAADAGVDTTDDGDMAEFCGGESSCMGSASHEDIPVIPEAELIDGVVYYPGLSNLHVTTAVDYPQMPPVGGEHNPIWQTCAIYTEPVMNEHAVHSMEHGTVWITYQPNLPLDQVQLLQEIARQGEFRLLSPYPDLPSPVVVTAWAYQLQLERAADPRLLDFLAVYEIGPTTPEPGAPCSNGESRTLRRIEEAPETDSQ